MNVPKIPIPKGLLDWLTSTDEKVEALHKDVAQGMTTIQNLIAVLPGAEEVPVPEKITRTVTIEQSLAPLEGLELEARSPLKGKIASITVHWPDGCDGLVDVAVGHGGTWLYPSEPDTFVALNDATPTIPMEEPVVWDERLWVIMSNTDGGNPHRISVIFIIIGVEEWQE